MQRLAIWLVPFGFLAGVGFSVLSGLDTFAWAGPIGNHLIGGLLGAMGGAMGSFFVGGGVGLSGGSGDALAYRNRLAAGKYVLIVEEESETRIREATRILRQFEPEKSARVQRAPLDWEIWAAIERTQGGPKACLGCGSKSHRRLGRWRKEGIPSFAAAGGALAVTGFFSPAFAHHALGGKLPATAWEGFLSGLAHPVIGLDHLAFVVAIGLVAAGQPWRYGIPLGFVLAGLGGHWDPPGRLGSPGTDGAGHCLFRSSLRPAAGAIAADPELALAASGDPWRGYSMAMPTPKPLSAPNPCLGWDIYWG
jgi:hypothetical protein